MPVRYNSQRGYMRSVVEGISGAVQRKVMEVLLESAVPMTRRMLEKQTNIRISTITTAVWVLLQSELIEESHHAIDPSSGFRAGFLRPVWPQPTQAEFDFTRSHPGAGMSTGSVCGL